jgi:hypothetical protein
LGQFLFTFLTTSEEFIAKEVAELQTILGAELNL